MRKNTSVTMKNVAVKAGCSQSTVSKALNNDPSIPEATRERVRQSAHDLGYRPNPMVSALMAQIHKTRPRSKSPALAALSLSQGEQSLRTAPVTVKSLAGARERAAEIGYQLELHEIDLAENDGSALLRQLRYRNVMGLLILPLPWSVNSLPFDLAPFATAAIGKSLQRPVLPQYSTHHGANLMLLLDTLVERGFRRIGFATSPGMSDRVENAWLGGYGRRYLMEMPETCPPYLGGMRTTEGLQAWLEAEKPDALIAKETWSVTDTLKNMGEKWVNLPVFTPGRCGVDDAPGIEELWHAIGRRAIEGVASQINHNQLGPGSHPELTLMRGICQF